MPASAQGDRALLSLDADLRDAVMAESSLERTRCEDVSLDDLLRVYQMAKIGIARGGWRPSAPLVGSYKRVRSFLLATGKLPS